ncbi:MAG TPA: hypothetical protein VJS37_09185 [Terriglobales bacterium]|nr:hypothetical protein [Terriglobales bacterium]
MVLRMNLQTFTLIHVLISLAGIALGIVVLYGFFVNKRMDGWTAVFFVTTALTSLTGFLFPFMGTTPAIKLGIISLVVLAIAIVTRYPLHLSWRKTYVIAACAVLYFNVFVLVVQLFEKVPQLKAIAPTQKEPPFAIAQIFVLALFVVLTTLAVKRFRIEKMTAARSSAKAA